MSSAQARPDRDILPDATSPRLFNIVRQGAAEVVTLAAAESPATLSSTADLRRALPAISRDPALYVVLIRSDAKDGFALARPTGTDAAAVLADDHLLFWMLNGCFKPSVAFVDGLIDGRGHGLVGYATHRVASEDYAASFPGPAAGWFPDCGAAWKLARMPGGIGAYLALTGARIDRADALRLGVVTHCIDRGEQAPIAAGLANADPIDPLLDRRHRDPGPGRLAALAEPIEQCFEEPATLAAITDRLRRLAARRSVAAEWAEATLGTIERAPALAAEVTLRHVRQARAMDLRQVLTVDYRLGSQLAALPRARLETVSAGHLDDLFAQIPGGGELILPTSRELLGLRA